MTDAQSSGTDTKHYQTDERSPPLRLSSRSWDGSPNTFIIAEDKRDGSWCRVGSVELSVGPVDARGVFVDDVISEWSFTRFHASGDRVAVDRRLVAHHDTENYRVKLEEQRRQVLGTGRREHSWSESQFWEWQKPVPGGRPQ